MIFKILLPRSVQTPNSDKNWQLANLLPIAIVCLQHISTFGVHYRTGSPGQLGLLVAGYPDHWVTKCDPVPCLTGMPLGGNDTVPISARCGGVQF